MLICTNFDPILSCCLSTKGSSIDHTKLVQWTYVMITDSKIDRLWLLMFMLDQLIPLVLMMVCILLKSLWCLECSIPVFDLYTETCNFTPHCFSVGARKIIIVSLLLIKTSILLIASLVTWKKKHSFLLKLVCTGYKKIFKPKYSSVRRGVCCVFRDLGLPIIWH